MSQVRRNSSGCFPQETAQDLSFLLNRFAQECTGLFRHRVVATGEDIHSCVTTFGPGMDGDVGFGQQGESGDALGLEVVRDQLRRVAPALFAAVVMLVLRNASSLSRLGSHS